MTEGQRLALEQLREIEAASEGVLEVVTVTDTSETQSHAIVELTVCCGDMPRQPEGLPLQDREPLRIWIPTDFPFRRPLLSTADTRWAGFAHVQWQRFLCLYQSPSTEWNPDDGMFGFIQRLDLWLRQGALGQLDPEGAPLHPPVAYIPSGTPRTVIPRVDTPPVGDAPWLGFAHLRVMSEQRVDLYGWSPVGSREIPGSVATAILLSKPLPFEFPTKVSDLLSELTTRGVPQDLLLLMLQSAVVCNDENSPLYVILGTPMRGVRGSGDLRQHLTAWYLEPVVALALRLAVEKYRQDETSQGIGQRCEQIVLDWAKGAKVAWCQVREDRPEVTIRRDIGSPLAWFSGRTVSVWGCGALGSQVGEFLARAGTRKLILWDNRTVGPGVLTRQLFDEADVGRAKVEALGDRLQRIRPDLEVDRRFHDILDGPLASEDWTNGADLIIDATASGAVLAKLELWRWTHPTNPVAVVSMVIGHRAEEGLVLVAGAGYSGGPADVSRSAKLAACNQPDCESFLAEFWPDRLRSKFFQPEPGCSESTFVGSAADVAVLTGLMLNHAAVDLAEREGRAASAHLVRQSHTLRPLSESLYAGFRWEADRVFEDSHTAYQVRITETAWKAILDWTERSRRRRGPRVETGGLLFGERDDAARVLWVTDVSGPPPDSRASAKMFLCGVEGTQETNRGKREHSHGSVQYVGMWHTHPESAPLPSSTDLDAMRRLTSRADPSPARVLLLIVGTPLTEPCVGVFLFSRRHFGTAV